MAVKCCLIAASHAYNMASSGVLLVAGDEGRGVGSRGEEAKAGA